MIIRMSFRVSVALSILVAFGCVGGNGGDVVGVAGPGDEAGAGSAARDKGSFVPPYALPAPGQAMALGAHTAQEIRPTQFDVDSWQYSLFDSYGGGVFVASFSKAGAYVIAGSGGHRSPEHTGGVAFDFETGTWQLLPDASNTQYVRKCTGSPKPMARPNTKSA